MVATIQFTVGMWLWRLSSRLSRLETQREADKAQIDQALDHAERIAALETSAKHNLENQRQILAEFRSLRDEISEGFTNTHKRIDQILN